MIVFKLISILGLFLLCNATEQETSPVYRIQNADCNQENQTLKNKSSKFSALWRTKKKRKTSFYCLWKKSPILWKIFSYLGDDLPQIAKLAPSKGWIEVFFRHYIAKHAVDYAVPTFLWKNDFDYQAIQLASDFLNFTTIWVHEGIEIRMTRRGFRLNIKKAQEQIGKDCEQFIDAVSHFQSEIDVSKNSATYFLVAAVALALTAIFASEWALGLSLFAFLFAFAFREELRKLRSFGISNPFSKPTLKSMFKQKPAHEHLPAVNSHPPSEYSEKNHNKSQISFALCLLLFAFVIQKK